MQTSFATIQMKAIFSDAFLHLAHKKLKNFGIFLQYTMIRGILVVKRFNLSLLNKHSSVSTNNRVDVVSNIVRSPTELLNYSSTVQQK